MERVDRPERIRLRRRRAGSGGRGAGRGDPGRRAAGPGGPAREEPPAGRQDPDVRRDPVQPHQRPRPAQPRVVSGPIDPAYDPARPGRPEHPAGVRRRAARSSARRCGARRRARRSRSSRRRGRHQDRGQRQGLPRLRPGGRRARRPAAPAGRSGATLRLAAPAARSIDAPIASDGFRRRPRRTRRHARGG